MQRVRKLKIKWVNEVENMYLKILTEPKNVHSTELDLSSTANSRLEIESGMQTYRKNDLIVDCASIWLLSIYEKWNKVQVSADTLEKFS